MYSTLLFIHSILRWILLFALLYSIYRGYAGWFGKSTFSRTDNRFRVLTVISAHLQLIVGLILFFISPIIKYFLNNFSDAVKISDFRFLAMEHTLLMLLAMGLITAGAAISKKKPTDKAKYKVIAIWFTIALIVIIVAIPWPLSPFGVERPLLRGF